MAVGLQTRFPQGFEAYTSLFDLLDLSSKVIDNESKLLLTEEQLRKFAYGVVRYMSHPLADVPIRITATVAAGAAQRVDASFNVLANVMGGLDAKGIPPPEGNFGPRIRALHDVRNSKCLPWGSYNSRQLTSRSHPLYQEFRTTMKNSDTFALKVAGYGVGMYRVINSFGLEL